MVYGLARVDPWLMTVVIKIGLSGIAMCVADRMGRVSHAPRGKPRADILSCSLSCPYMVSLTNGFAVQASSDQRV